MPLKTSHLVAAGAAGVFVFGGLAGSEIAGKAPAVVAPTPEGVGSANNNTCAAGYLPVLKVLKHGGNAVVLKVEIPDSCAPTADFRVAAVGPDGNVATDAWPGDTLTATCHLTGKAEGVGVSQINQLHSGEQFTASIPLAVYFGAIATGEMHAGGSADSQVIAGLPPCQPPQQ